MFDKGSYGTTSIMSAKMAEWQGPALYVYNDSKFTERDFKNLAKIGQGSKLDKLNTTGRFGVFLTTVSSLGALIGVF